MAVAKKKSIFRRKRKESKNKVVYSFKNPLSKKKATKHPKKCSKKPKKKRIYRTNLKPIQKIKKFVRTGSLAGLLNKKPIEPKKPTNGTIANWNQYQSDMITYRKNLSKWERRDKKIQSIIKKIKNRYKKRKSSSGHRKSNSDYMI